MQTDLLSIKKEVGKEKSTPACSRTGKDKEPVCQNVSQGVREEGWDAPEDESMQDNDHLFGMSGPIILPLQTIPSHTDSLRS